LTHPIVFRFNMAVSECADPTPSRSHNPEGGPLRIVGDHDRGQLIALEYGFGSGHSGREGRGVLGDLRADRYIGLILVLNYSHPPDGESIGHDHPGHTH
jgi:hypothetical protein